MNPVAHSLFAEYAALEEAAGLADRSSQAWLKLTGKDGQDWLNRMCTNLVAGLPPGRGCDAFCTNEKGRILFEIAAFVGQNEVFVSLDRSRLPVALAHFDKYIIADDVQLADLTPDVDRLGLAGPKAGEFLVRLGLKNAGAMNAGDHAVIEIAHTPVPVARSNFAGRTGFDLVIPKENAAEVKRELERVGAPLPLFWLEPEAVEVARVEAGRAAWGREITEDIISNETAQEPRAIHYNKGCYLGQEIVIRIHHQGAPAKFLRGLKIEPCADAPEALPALDAAVCKKDDPGGASVGTMTSMVQSPRLGILALAYLKRGIYEALPALELREANGCIWSAQAVGLPFEKERLP